MTEPTYGTTTERIWRRLPEAYRNLDARNDWHFKKLVSAIGDQQEVVDLLIARLEYILPEDRVDYYASLNQYNTYQRPAGTEDPEYGWDPIGETSDLLDPRTADAGWLDYIAQLIGADLRSITDPDVKRDALILNYLGYRAGSREALEDAVKRVLTGTKYSRVYPHRDGAGGDVYSIGTQWDILIVTRADESPSSATIIAEVLSKGAKPAGVVLHHLTYELTWSILENDLTTWSAIEAIPDWQTLETGTSSYLP